MTERADNPPVAGAAGEVRIETGELTSFSRPDLEDICDAAEARTAGGSIPCCVFPKAAAWMAR